MGINLKPILEESKILEFTNGKYGKSEPIDKVIYTDPYYRFSRIIEEVPFKDHHEDEVWLDLGCHHGQFLELVEKVFHYKTIGMDDWNLKQDLGFTNFNYYKTDLANSEWVQLVGVNKTNVISALEVLEHMIDTESFLQACSSCLIEKGYLVISTPNINCLRNRLIVPFGKYPVYLEYKNIIHHVRLFNVETLSLLLKENGFIVKKITGVKFLPERILKYSFFEKISKVLARFFPSLCGNLIVVAQKIN